MGSTIEGAAPVNGTSPPQSESKLIILPGQNTAALIGSGPEFQRLRQEAQQARGGTNPDLLAVTGITTPKASAPLVVTDILPYIFFGASSTGVPLAGNPSIPSNMLPGRSMIEAQLEEEPSGPGGMAVNFVNFNEFHGTTLPPEAYGRKGQPWGFVAAHPSIPGITPEYTGGSRTVRNSQGELVGYDVSHQGTSASSGCFRFFNGTVPAREMLEAVVTPAESSARVQTTDVRIPYTRLGLMEPQTVSASGNNAPFFVRIDPPPVQRSLMMVVKSPPPLQNLDIRETAIPPLTPTDVVNLVKAAYPDFSVVTERPTGAVSKPTIYLDPQMVAQAIQSSDFRTSAGQSNALNQSPADNAATAERVRRGNASEADVAAMQRWSVVRSVGQLYRP